MKEAKLLTTLLFWMMLHASQPEHVSGNLVRLPTPQLQRMGVIVSGPAGIAEESIVIDKSTLGCLLLLVDFLKRKTSANQLFAPVTIDATTLVKSNGKEFEVLKANPNIKDWRLALRYPRDLDVIWFLETKGVGGMLKYEDTERSFLVTPLAHTRFENAYNQTFPPVPNVIATR
jgi:hypothetical protein